MYTKFEKSNLERFRGDLKDALKDFETKHGVKVDVAGITYTELELSVSVKVKINTPGVDNARQLFIKNAARHFNVKNSMYLATFKDKGKVYQIIGCSFSSAKYPLECKELTTGKIVNYNAEYVSKLLNNEN